MQTKHFYRSRGACFGDLLAAIVEHCAHLTKDLADNKRFADAQRTLLDEGGGDRAAATVQFGFEHHARCQTRGTGAQIQNVGSQQDRFQQRFDVLALLRGNQHHFGFAAPFHRRQSLLCEFLLNAIGIRVGLVDLVDGHDDGDAGGAGVFDCFNCLWHDAVVGRDDQDDYVGGFRSAGTHQRKRLVAGSVEEDHAPLLVRIIGAGNLHAVDVLRDAAGFTRGDVSRANRIQQ